MNSGGIAIRLINLAQVMVGRVPGSLGHVNVLANMMFGSIFRLGGRRRRRSRGHAEPHSDAERLRSGFLRR